MAIAGSPKKLAQDIRDGFFVIAPSALRKYTPQDIKTVLANLALVARELRQETIPLENVPALKRRNMQLSRLHQAEVVIRSFCKQRHIPI